MKAEARAEFAERGILRIDAAIDRAVMEAMATRLWDHLAERRDIHRNRPETWRPFNVSAVRTLKDDDVFGPAFGGPVHNAIEQLLGDAGWVEPRHAGQLLFTIPSEVAWFLPHKVWHFDAPAPGWMDGLPGVQCFVFLEDVPPKGGGTLAVAGSQRWVDRLRREGPRDAAGKSAQLRRALAERVPWFHDLWEPGDPASRVARFMRQAEDAAGIPLQVVELAGAPGDAVLMHPWVVHAPSMNSGGRPRLMLTERYGSRFGIARPPKSEP